MDNSGGRVYPPMDSPSERQLGWGWVLTFGIMLMVAGFAALGASLLTTMITVTFLGWLLLFGGIVDIVAGFTARSIGGFGLHLVTGILVALVGLLLITNPVAGAEALTVILALMLIAAGAARIVYSASERYAGWGWSTLSGGLAMFLGILVLVRYPTSAVWFLGVVVGVELVFRGAVWIASSFAVRDAHKRVKAMRPPTGIPRAHPGTA
jgi:uncharacterized membrane protein HdeD (DUF308 family)